MASGINLFHKLQQSVSQIDPWIAGNKPTPSKSELVFKAFMARYGSSIKGSDAFVAKVTRIIEKASRLAAGSTVMQRLLDTSHHLSIEEEKEESFFTPPSSLKFNSHGPRWFYVCLNNQGERILHRLPRTTTFIHECLHAWHEFIAPDKHEERDKQLGLLSEIHSAEEELTITGNLHLDAAANTDPCCENTALRELGYPLRISHRGINHEIPDLHESVRHRLFPRIRELANSSQIHNDKQEDLTALELAMHLYLLEGYPEILHEWIETMRLLIRGGCQSEYALKLAILINSEEIIELLLEVGAEVTQEMLDDAIKISYIRFTKTWKVLEQKKWVYSLDKLWTMYKDLVLPPGAQNPIIALFQKHDRQQAAVKAKFFTDNKALPIETLQKLFALNDFKGKETFVKWSLSHPSYRLPLPQPAASVPLQNAGIYGCNATTRPPNQAFVCMSNGTYTPTEAVYSSYPKCYKFFKDFEKLNSHLFTRAEIDRFTQAINYQIVKDLAQLCSSETMRAFGYYYSIRYQNSYYNVYHNLVNTINTHLLATFASVGPLLEEKQEDGNSPIYCVNTPILSEIGHYQWEENPISSATCRLFLKERWNDNWSSLNFGVQILINDTVIHQKLF